MVPSFVILVGAKDDFSAASIPVGEDLGEYTYYTIFHRQLGNKVISRPGNQVIGQVFFSKKMDAYLFKQKK